MKFTLAFVLAMLMAPLWAHHGSAGFDQNKPVHLVGKVSLVEWTNPHVVVHLEVTDPDGKAVTWLINTLPPNAATRQGVPKTSFEAGTEISVDGYQALDGSNHVNGTNLVFKDGKKIVTSGCFGAEDFCYKPADGKK